MTGVASAAEASVAKMIGAAYTGVPSDDAPVEIAKFEFDSTFQTKIAALTMRDDEFMRRASHLLHPDHFESIGEATIVSIVLAHYQKYQCVPATSSLTTLIRENVVKGVIRKDAAPLVVAAWKVLQKDSLADRGYVEDKLAEFARHQAVSQAILNSVDLLEKKQFPKIEAAMKKAIEIGLNEEGDIYDYFEKAAARTEERTDRLAGKLPPTGITTGIHRMDELLFHKGWGRRELATIMGGAKAGKTTALINFAKSAALAGHNVLYATLEVSSRIVSERLDACVTDTLMKDLDKSMKSVEAKLNALAARSGKLNIVEFPSGSLSPQMLQKILEKHRSKGTSYDLVVVDYADIMKPNHRMDDVIENSKSVYIDLRALAFEFNVAMLTATQTNREGFKATVAKAEHVSEDFNKVRTVDLMISINKTEEEAKKGEARLYFAASRNQESGFTIVIKQNLAMMKFVESVIGVI